jgi:hypothetical protein
MNRIRPLVVICGSLHRAGDAIIEAAREEWRAGNYVYAPVLQPGITDDEHECRHRAMMRDADEIVVAIGPDEIIGSATTAEISYAETLCIPVRYYREGEAM